MRIQDIVRPTAIRDMVGTPRQKARLAARRLMLDGRNQPTPDAARLLKHLRTFTGAGRTPARYSAVTHTTDPMATGMAIGMAMVYEELCQLLYLDEIQRRTTGDDE